VAIAGAVEATPRYNMYFDQYVGSRSLPTYNRFANTTVKVAHCEPAGQSYHSWGNTCYDCICRVCALQLGRSIHAVHTLGSSAAAI
jgi:hypothetical protein